MLFQKSLQAGLAIADTLQRLFSKHPDQLKAILEAVEQLEEKQKTHDEEVTRLQQEKSNLHDEVKQADVSIEELRSYLNTTQSQVINLNTTINADKETIEKQKADIESLEDENKRLHDENVELSHVISELRDDKTELDFCLKEAEQQREDSAAYYMEQIEKLQQEILELKSKIPLPYGENE